MRGEPNINGVFIEPDEELVLPHPRMAWDRADIRLQQVEDGWAMGCAVHCNTGGMAMPCSARFGTYPSRDSAVDAAISRIRDRIKADKGTSDWREITQWLDGVKPAQMSLF